MSAARGVLLDQGQLVHALDAVGPQPVGEGGFQGLKQDLGRGAADHHFVFQQLLDGELDAAALADHRLVTILGPGGMGKTRLAIEAQRVVVAIGIRQDDTIHQQIKSLGYETHVIGDCLEPRTAKSAIYEGAKLGRSI